MSDVLSTYVIPLLLLVTIAYLLKVVAKVHRNAKSIDSPDSLIQELHKLRADLERLRKTTEARHRESVTSLVKLNQEGFEKLLNDSLKRSETNTRIQENLVRLLGEQASRFSEIEAILGALRDQASNADRQLRRYQEGYHWTINKSLILGILRTLDEIDDRLEVERAAGNLSAPEALDFIKDHLEILLSNEGVSAVEPPVGADYAQYRKTATAVPVPTEDRHQNNLIASVIRPGFICETGAEPPPLIRPAEVGVFQHQAQQNEVAQ